MNTVSGVAPQFANEHSQALYSYWTKKRGVAVAPSKSAINPTDIPDLLARLYMLERQRDGSLRWRLHAFGLALLFGRDLTGTVFDPAEKPRHDQRFLRIFSNVTERSCGAVIQSQAHTTGGRTVKLEQLCLPLLGDSGASTIVLVHTALVEVARRDVHDLGQIIEVKVDRYYCFNAGVRLHPISSGRTVT